MLGVLDEVGFEAALCEGFGGLDADESGAEDDGSRARGLAQGESVVDRAQGVHTRGVEAVNRGPAGEGSRGEDQVFVGERVGRAGLRVGDLDAVRAGVDRRDLGVDAHVEVERRLERLRGVEEEFGGVFDLTADVVREPAVREGHVLAALQHDDLGALVAPAQARCRAHATGDSSDNYNSHLRLTFWLEGWSSLAVLMISAEYCPHHLLHTNKFTGPNKVVNIDKSERLNHLGSQFVPKLTSTESPRRSYEFTTPKAINRSRSRTVASE